MLTEATADKQYTQQQYMRLAVGTTLLSLLFSIRADVFWAVFSRLSQQVEARARITGLDTLKPDTRE